MPVRLTRLSLLLTLVIALLGIVGFAGAAASAAPVSPAVSQPAVAGPSAAGELCVKPKKRDDDTIHILGCLRDQREKPAVAVPDVRIVIEDEAGTEVGEDTTDATGIFDIRLPGESIDVLGNTYIVKIDDKTMPDGADLRDPSKKDLEVTINLDADRFVTFPIADKIEKESKFDRGLQLFIGGLVFALILAMASLGLSMIFGTTGLTNFSHGELITFGALIAFAVDQMPGNITLFGMNITMVVAIVVATIASGLFGYLQEKSLWRPLRRRATGLIAAMIVSIGLSIFLRNLYQYFAGASNHNYTQWSSPQPWTIGTISITPKSVGVMIFATVVLIAVSFAVQKTKIGKATRAVADNPALASSSGINVDRVIATVWTVGAALAGLAGVLLGMTQGFDYQLGFKILLLVFAAVVLGGLGSIWGALIGSLIIGIVIEVSTLFIPAELKFVGALLLLILILLIRPQGILGRSERVG